MTFVHVTVGSWTLFFPRSFYGGIPTVDDYPPFNEHLFRDYGAMNLAMAVVLCAAAVFLERTMVYVALTSSIFWAVPHLVFHAAHPSRTAASMLVAVLIVIAAIPLVLLLLTHGALPAGERRRPSLR
ncbi:hypothetical protein [Saccharopolyspora pogona]|uniref:hypothetical protein n=1 Tax=Saccharopolyspora pogona TaxID=333966 RepID=UPI001CC24E01|nr:hypothetical protein [Saccharopolyspora pogona]